MSLKLSILNSPCDQCPFKGNMNLRSGRIKGIIEDTTTGNGGQGSYFSCHKTIDYDLPEEERSDAVFHGAAVCAGWLEAVEKLKKVPAIIQIARRLGLVREVDPYEAS